eukprot:11366615-Alexandrium_andersonii.AAC.1
MDPPLLPKGGSQPPDSPNWRLQRGAWHLLAGQGTRTGAELALTGALSTCAQNLEPALAAL